MSSTFHPSSSAAWLTRGLWLLSVGVVALLAWAWCRLPDIPVGGMPAPVAAEAASTGQPGNGPFTGNVWSVFRAREDQAVPPAAAGAPAAKPFRLAGTFFVEGGAEGTTVHKAILDEVATRQQHIVAEGDTVGSALVERIYYDHVVLRTGAGAEEIWLDFAGHETGFGQAVATAATQDVVAVATETNRFGVKTMEGRWEFKRRAVLDYYQELLDDPERMVAVFDSLKPVYNKDRKITGYSVGVEGEQDFFKAVGLKNGDVVRNVNSLPMTNRRRSEFMINEFLNDRMNIVVLDIEREGNPSKLIYEVRP
jgi:type II secretory pathway component PulC